MELENFAILFLSSAARIITSAPDWGLHKSFQAWIGTHTLITKNKNLTLTAFRHGLEHIHSLPRIKILP
jgi:hypothetical protein